MSRLTSAFLLTIFATAAMAEGNFPGIGRPATQPEIQAWDIDVRADFMGLPAGSGSVKHGGQVWDAKCASCHGTFGESNSVSSPIVGETTSKDMAVGRVAALRRPDVGLTTLMKLSTLSTLWDYINRAMPWDAPKSLSVGEVYAVCAYILYLGNIVPDDLVLSETNIAAVQKLLPNRHGFTRAHGLWVVNGKPDVHNSECMTNCIIEGNAASQPPGFARSMQGNLAAQNRRIGGVRGMRTEPAN